MDGSTWKARCDKDERANNKRLWPLSTGRQGRKRLTCFPIPTFFSAFSHPYSHSKKANKMRARELSFTGRTIVVTGGTGFLGSHLVPFVCSSLSSTPRPLVATYSSSNNKINRTSLKLASRGASIKVIARRVANTIDEKLEHFFHRGLEWCQLSRSEIHTLFGGATDDQIIETLCSRISCFSGSVDDLEFMNLVMGHQLELHSFRKSSSSSHHLNRTNRFRVMPM